MSTINCATIKANSASKTDIRIVIHDTQIQKRAELGFSIKSKIGGDATLLNAGNTTNFIYEIKGIRPNKTQIDTINAIDTKSKIKDRIAAIKKLGGQLAYSNLENYIFKNNLILIDSLLPSILAELLLVFFTSTNSSVQDLTDEIKKTNPIQSFLNTKLR